MMTSAAPITARATQRGRPLKAHNTAPTTSPDDRAQRAYELRASGLSFGAIARQLGYADRASAYNAAHRHASALVPAGTTERKRRRAQELAKLDRLWALVEPCLGSADGRIRAAALNRALTLMQLYAVWYGVVAIDTPPAARLAHLSASAEQVTSR